MMPAGRRGAPLFSAALIEVGLVSMLRLDKIPIGPFNTGAFGWTETEEGVRMLAATGRNDARVSPWMPAKFDARLQAATAGPRPLLLRVDDAGGHGGGTRDQAEQEAADFYSFLLWQAGAAGFQP